MISRKKNRSYLRTESGNAEMFASLHGKTVKFDHKQQRWLIWDNKRCRWIEDKQGKVRGRMKLTTRQLFKTAVYSRESEERTKQIAWALRSEQRYPIDAALELAKSIAPVSDDGESWDADPWLLGVPNGVVDLFTGKLRTAKPEDRVTLYSPVTFDPNAKCPRFEKFMLEICNGDAELAGFLQRAVGYSLTGYVDEQCLFACYGTGANGKSTLLGVLHFILGDYAVNLPFTALELNGRSSISNDVAMLPGRRFATAIETGESVRLNEARIKAITGGDPITARRLYHENFTFNPTHKLWLSFNHKPLIVDDSDGMWRRVRLIRFNRQFGINERDKKLLDTLKAEASGILSWAVRGSILWQKTGLAEPRQVTAATTEYRSESDHFGKFVADCCILRPNQTVTSATLWEHYQLWTSGNGELPLSRAAFAERLRSRGFTEKRLGHAGTRGWSGIGLAEPPAIGSSELNFIAANQVPSLAEFAEKPMEC